MNSTQFISIGIDTLVLVAVGVMLRYFSSIITSIEEIKQRVSVVEKIISKVTEVKIKKD